MPTVRLIGGFNIGIFTDIRGVESYIELSGKSVMPIPAATNPFNASISSPSDVIFGVNPTDLQASTATLCNTYPSGNDTNFSSRRSDKFIDACLAKG